jgi:hypothetical protein
MSVHILYDQFKNKSAMYCSTSGLAFGPTFNSDDAAAFVDEMLAAGTDPRALHADDLAIAIEAWEERYYDSDER